MSEPVPQLQPRDPVRIIRDGLKQAVRFNAPPEVICNLAAEAATIDPQPRRSVSTPNKTEAKS